MDNLSKLTVIIPTYNRKKLLYKTLKLLEKQTNQNFYIIIVDNNSDYNIEEEILENFSMSLKKKTTILKNNYNIGLKGNLAKIMSTVKEGWFWTLGDDEIISLEAIEIIYQEIKQCQNSKIGHIIFSATSVAEKYKKRYSFENKIFYHLNDYINYSYERRKNYQEEMTFTDLMSIFLSINVFNVKLLKEYLGESYSYAYTGATHVIPSLLALRDEKIFIKSSSKNIVEIIELTNVKEDLLKESEVWGKNFYPIMLGLSTISSIDFKDKLSKDELGKLFEMMVWFPVKLFFIESIIKGKEFKRMYNILYNTNFKYSFNKKRKYEAYIYNFLLKTIFLNDKIAMKLLIIIKKILKRGKNL